MSRVLAPFLAPLPIRVLAARAAAGVVDKKKSSQQGKMTAAILLFWPVAFIVDDNSLEAQKYARLKGEYEAALRIHVKRTAKKL